MGQMLVEGGEAERNLARAVSMIRLAADAACEVVVLPECLDLGWMDPAARTQAQPIPGRHSQRLCDAAREAGIHVAAGIVERAGDRLYNAAVLIAPDGLILGKHRKINELDIALDLYTPGASLHAIPAGFGPAGLVICADLLPSSSYLGRAAAHMGARILLSPCAWAVTAKHDNAQEPYGGTWRESYTRLAELHGIPVVGVSNVGWIREGAWKGWKCIGCSLAVGAGGDVLLQGPYGDSAESFMSVEVEIRPAVGTA